jgi:hypothetical protein
VGEIAEIARDNDIHRVTFLDDVFPWDSEWTAEFTKTYSKHFKFPFAITTTAEKLNETDLELLKGAGCEAVVLGVETGNQAFRKRLSDRNVGDKNVIKAASLVQSMGVKLVTTNMIGLPLETPELIKETLELNKKLRASDVRVSIYDPLPSTPLFELCKEKGYLTERSRSELKPWESTLSLPTLSAGDLRDSYEKFHLLNSLLHVANLQKRKGYFDSIAALPKAKIVSESRSDVQAKTTHLYGETRNVIAQRVNSTLKYEAELEENSAVSLGIAIVPSMKPVKGKVFFSIEVVQNGREQTVFQKTLTLEEKEQMRWFDYDLPLLDIKTGSARILFKIGGLNVESGEEIWGLWSHPFLSNRLTKVEGKIKVVETTASEDAYEIKRQLEEKEKLCASLKEKSQEVEEQLKELEEEIKKKTQRIAELTLKLHEVESNREKDEKYIMELEQIRDEYQRSLGKKIKGIFRKK